jgi:predicted lipoprotein with Yx(FWY)xxD motif
LLLVPAAAGAEEDYTVQVHQDPKLGAYLTDARGMTLYLLKKDAANTSACYDACAQSWPAFTAGGPLTLPDGVAGHLGTITRKDGTRQVTYNGVPLYYFAKDQKPGDANGQGLGNVWFVMAPRMEAGLPATGGVPVGVALVVGIALAGIGGRLRAR